MYPIKKLKHNSTGLSILPSAEMGATVAAVVMAEQQVCQERAAMATKEEPEALAAMPGQEASAEPVA